MFGRGAPRVHDPGLPHEWEPIRRGFPQMVCRCGVLHSPGGVKAGRNTIEVGPVGLGDVLLWSGAGQDAGGLGQLAMRTNTGRPSFFMDGDFQGTMSPSETPPRRTWELQQNPNTAVVIGKGTTNLPTVEGTPAVLETNDGQFIQNTSLAVVGSDAGWISTTFDDFRRQHNIQFDAIIRTGLITNARYWIGLFSADPMGSALPAVHFAGVRFDTSVPDAAWRFVTGDGVGTTVAVGTSPIAAGTSYFIRIVAHPSGAGNVVRLSIGSILPSGMSFVFIDNVLTTLPAAAQNLGYVAEVRTLDAVAKTIGISKISAAVHPIVA
ncbi:MAG: hypothetical protein ACREI9_07685 [Nitrospiraceae bacterium]